MTEDNDLLSVMMAYAKMLGDERERMGFVWSGDMEKDPRFMDGDPRCEQTGRVVWARDKDDGLHVLEDGEWHKVDDERWTKTYPHAPLPPHLPKSST